MNVKLEKTMLATSIQELIEEFELNTGCSVEQVLLHKEQKFVEKYQVSQAFTDVVVIQVSA